MAHDEPSVTPRRRRAARGRAIAAALSVGGTVALTTTIAVTNQPTAAPAAPRPTDRAPAVDRGPSENDTAPSGASSSAVPFVDPGPAPAPHTRSAGS